MKRCVLVLICAMSACSHQSTPPSAACEPIAPAADERATQGYGSLTDDATYAAGAWYGPDDVGIVGWSALEDEPIYATRQCAEVAR